MAICISHRKIHVQIDILQFTQKKTSQNKHKKKQQTITNPTSTGFDTIKQNL